MFKSIILNESNGNKLDTCRLCLKRKCSELLPIDTDVIVKIKSCTSIDIKKDNDFPRSICKSCYQKLRDAYSFRTTCLQSDKILRQSQESSNTSIFENKKIYTTVSFTDNESSEDEFDLINENSLHSGWPENTYTCEICSSEFNRIFDYLDHQLTHNGSPVFKCDKCSVILTTRQDLVTHDRTHKISCPECGKIMKKSSLQLHLISHTDKFKCTECSQTCSSKTALEQHRITVHTDIKSYICENCGKNFSSGSSLRTHLLSHGEERKYPCNICSYAGRTASAIYIHLSKHAKDTCICRICAKVFKSNRNLNDHLRRVHSKVKKHVCAYCNRQFVDHYMLKVHLRIHTGSRPYKCNECDKSFFRSDGLKEHKVVHQERTMFNCDKCHKQYMSKRGVSRHNCIAKGSS